MSQRFGAASLMDQRVYKAQCSQVPLDSGLGRDSVLSDHCRERIRGLSRAECMVMR